MKTHRLMRSDNVCAQCGLAFATNHQSPYDYGVVQWSTNAGEQAFINPEVDPVWKEIEGLLYGALGIEEGGPEIDDSFRAALGLTIDPSPLGRTYCAWGQIACPRCGSLERLSSGPSKPPQFLDVPETAVTHERWLALAEDERRRMVEEVALASLPRVRRLCAGRSDLQGPFAEGDRARLKGIIERLQALERMRGDP
jgi:hypothetical protein